MKTFKQQAAHLQLLSMVTCSPASCCRVENYFGRLHREIKSFVLMAGWVKANYWPTSLLKQSVCLAALRTDAPAALLCVCCTEPHLPIPPPTTGVAKLIRTEIWKEIQLKHLWFLCFYNPDHSPESTALNLKSNYSLYLRDAHTSHSYLYF